LHHGVEDFRGLFLSRRASCWFADAQTSRAAPDSAGFGGRTVPARMCASGVVINKTPGEEKKS